MKQADLVIRSDSKQAKKLEKTVKKLKKNLKSNPGLEDAWKPTLRLLKEDAKRNGKNAKNKRPNPQSNWKGWAQ